MEIETDASLLGWGASCENTSTGGQWSFDEQQNHINQLKLYAIFLVLKMYANDLTDIHMKHLSDNTTSVLVLSHMGIAVQLHVTIYANKFGFGALNVTYGYQLHISLANKI